MEPTVVWYLRMSVIYFVAGAVIGLGLLVWPDESGYFIPVHVHLNLLGFMSMMIYGVGYHILPKFSGRLIYSAPLVKVQFWLSNAGLLGMAFSWPFTYSASSLPETMLMVSALAVLLSVMLFAFNILKTVKSV